MDSFGFHQSDNHPAFDLQPVTETPEVKQARKEHEILWKAAARLNGVDLDSNDLYNPNAERLENDNYDDDKELEGQVSNQHQSLARYPVLPYSQHITPENAQRFGKVVDDSVIVDSSVNSNQLRLRYARQQQNEEEVTSRPRGFFYKFNYPVPFIVDRNTRSKRMPETQSSDKVESLGDIRFSKIYASAVPTEITRIDSETQGNSQNILDGTLPQDEVHDIQISPKQQKVTEQKYYDIKVKENLDENTTIKVNRSRGSVKFSINLNMTKL